MQHLSSTELAVMNLIWNAEDRVTAKQIREALYPNASKAQHGTVQKLLQKLEEKGFVQRDKSLVVHFFTPAISPEEYAGGQMKSLADKLAFGSIAPIITNLVESNDISKKEIDRIRAAIEHRKKTTKNNPS